MLPSLTDRIHVTSYDENASIINIMYKVKPSDEEKYLPVPKVGDCPLLDYYNAPLSQHQALMMALQHEINLRQAPKVVSVKSDMDFVEHTYNTFFK